MMFDYVSAELYPGLNQLGTKLSKYIDDSGASIPLQHELDKVWIFISVLLLCLTKKDFNVEIFILGQEEFTQRKSNLFSAASFIHSTSRYSFKK